MDAQHPACSSVPSHPFGVLLTAWRPNGHSTSPDYSVPSWLLGALLWLLGALLVHRRFPVCSSPLAIRYPQWPSWSLLALLAARPHPSGWHLLGIYLIVWQCPDCSAGAQELCSSWGGGAGSQGWILVKLGAYPRGISQCERGETSA